MATGGGKADQPEDEPGQRTDRMLLDVVRDADEYYNSLTRRHANEMRLDVAVVSIVVWFAAFAVLGLGSLAVFGQQIYYIVISFLTAIAIAAGAAVVTYASRRKRGFKFDELGALVKKMKEGGPSSEDGLRLTDAMHRAALVARKRKMDSAFEYAVIAFALVVVIGMNAAVGVLAAVIVYLYFRFEALREYERADRGYENSKKELLQSL